MATAIKLPDWRARCRLAVRESDVLASRLEAERLSRRQCEVYLLAAITKLAAENALLAQQLECALVRRMGH